MDSFRLCLTATFFLFCIIVSILLLISGFSAFTVGILSMLFALMIFWSFFLSGIASRLIISILSATHIVGMWTLFFLSELYTFSGWTAVKAFNFSAEDFWAVFFPILLLYSISLITLTLLDFLSPVFRVVSSSRDLQRGDYISTHRTTRYRVLLVVLVLVMLPVHDFMWSNVVAVTGQSHLQQDLPFKLGGFLFISQKLFFQ